VCCFFEYLSEYILFIGSLKAGFVTERSELSSCRAFRFQYPILIGIRMLCDSIRRGYGDQPPLTPVAALERRGKTSDCNAPSAARRSPRSAWWRRMIVGGFYDRLAEARERETFIISLGESRKRQ